VLPPTIGGAGSSSDFKAFGMPKATQRSSAAFGNSQRPVTLLQGTMPAATSS
jgi:hypothetical protein